MPFLNCISETFLNIFFYVNEIFYLEVSEGGKIKSDYNYYKNKCLNNVIFLNFEVVSKSTDVLQVLFYFQNFEEIGTYLYF